MFCYILSVLKLWQKALPNCKLPYHYAEQLMLLAHGCLVLLHVTMTT